MDIERVSLLKVPIDILPPERLAERIYELLAADEAQTAKGGGAQAEGRQAHNIVLLSLWDLLRARLNNDYRSYVLKAALVIPISRSLQSGIRFLTGKTAVRYMPFDFVISLLTALEEREYTLYLIGGKAQILRKTENNIRQTFPRLRIVGRYHGGFKRQDEPSIVEAIRKASPSLLLVGRGVRGEEQWIAKHTGKLNQGIRLWCSDLYDVFAERRRRPSRQTFERGWEWMAYCLRNPLLYFRIFPYIYYKILLLIYKIFRKE